MIELLELSILIITLIGILSIVVCLNVKEGDAEALDYAIRLIKSIKKLKEELK